MPSTTAPDNGTGATIVFGTSGFAGEITGFSAPNESRVSIDVSHLASTSMTYIPGDLVEGGEVSLDLNFNPDYAVPVSGAAETITISYALRSGDSTASTWAFTGFVTDHTPSVPFEDRMTATVTIKVSGVVTKTLAT